MNVTCNMHVKRPKAMNVTWKMHVKCPKSMNVTCTNIHLSPALCMLHVETFA